jgi:translocation and assembly module TamB
MNPLARKIALAAGAVALVLVAAAAAGTLWLRSAPGRDWLAGTLTAALSGPGRSARIDGLSGSLPGSVAIARVALEDREGPWVEIENLSLHWSPLSLLTGTLWIDSLEAGRIAMQRLPAPAEPAAPSASPPLTRLPVGIRLDRLAVARAELGQAIAGSPAVLSLDGAARVSTTLRGSLHLGAARIDGRKGVFAVSADVDPARRLDFQARIDEEPGGLVATLAALPGAPAVSVEASGAGPWDDWQARLEAHAGPDTTLELTANLAPEGPGRRLQLLATGAVAALLPDRLAALAGNRLRLEASALLPRRGPVQLDAATLTAGLGTLSVSGQIDPDRGAVDIRYDLAAGPESGLHELVVEPVWQRLSLTGTAKGPIATPAITARLTATAPALRRVAGKQLRVVLDASPADARGGALTVKLDALIDALSSEDPRLAKLAGEQITLKAEGLVAPQQGTLRIEHFALDAAVATLTGRASAAGWGDDADAVLQLDAHDLATLGLIVGRPLKGTAKVDAKLQRHEGRLAGEFALSARNLVLGQALADALLAGEARANARFELTEQEPEAVSVPDFTLTSAVLKANGNLHYGRAGATGQFTMDIPDLAPLSNAAGVNLGGNLRLQAALSGKTTDLTVKADAAADSLSVNGQQFTALRLASHAEGLPNAPRGDVRLESSLDGLPVSLQAPFATVGSMLKLDRIAADLGGNHIEGSLEVAMGGTHVANGRLLGTFDDLATLGRLAGADASGKLRTQVVLTGNAREQSVTVDANGQALSWRQGADAAALKKLTLALRADRLTTAPSVDARLAIAGLSRNDLRLRQFEATARGPLSGMALTASGRGRAGRPLEVDAAAQLARDMEVTRIVLTRLTGRYGPEPFQLTQRATIESGPTGVSVQHLRLSLGSGRASADLDLRGSAFSGTVLLSALPLRLARLINPVADVEGTLDGRLALAGSRTDPRAELSVKAAKVRAAGTEALRGFDLDASGSWRDGRLRLDATADTDGGQPDVTAQAQLALRLPAGALAPELPQDEPVQARLDGGIDVARFNDLLAAQGDRAAGRLTLHATVGGTLAVPEIAGTAAVEDGRYENVKFGTTITDLTLRLSGNNDALQIQTLEAHTPGGGTIGGSGAVRFAAGTGAGLIDIRLRMENAQVAAVDLVRARADATLALSGTFAQSILAGSVRVRRAEINIPDRLPAEISEVKVVEINGPMATGAATADVEEAAGPGMVMGLDLRVRADNQVYVRGRGLDSEFKADLTVKGTSSKPLVAGQVELVKGSLSALGKTFTLSKATATFLGDETLQPQLDIEAQAKARDLTAVIQVTGRLPRPQVELTSDPAAPRDEVLSRLLFDRPVGELSAFDALQLAQSAAQLSGIFGGGPGVLDRVKRSLGVDRLEFKGSETGQGAGAVAAGRYIGRRTYVGVEQDLGTGQSKATVEYEINKHINLQAGVGNDNEVGVEFKWDY